MLCGCIDIGTNTTRVLVAEARDGRLTEVLQRRAFTRLGRGLAPGGRIPEARIAENAGVVAEQLALAEQAGAQTVRTVATAVIRSALNRDEFCAAMREHGGVDVCVLDGEEEARLAFLGATRTLQQPLAGRVAVVDVGGGSTEIAIGTRRRRRRVVALVRVRLGLPRGRLPRRATRPRWSELDDVRYHAAQMLEDADPPPVDAAVAVGGSAASLRRLVGEVLDRHSLAPGALHADQRSGSGRRRPLRARPAAGAADARRAARAGGRGPRARQAAADRARGPARGSSARPGRRVTTRSRNFCAKCDHSWVVTDVTSAPEITVPDLDGPQPVLQPRALVDGVQRPRPPARRGLAVPLLERVKFLAIVSSNLDEFFMVRVAGLHDQIDAGIEKPLQDGRTPSETIGVLRESCASTPRASAAAWTASCGPRWPSTGSGSSATTTSTGTSGARSTSASGARSSPC